MEEQQATSHKELWIFVLEHATTVTGADRASEATIAFWAYLHGTAQLEAIKVFGDVNPAKPSITVLTPGCLRLPQTFTHPRELQGEAPNFYRIGIGKSHSVD